MDSLGVMKPIFSTEMNGKFYLIAEIKGENGAPEILTLEKTRVRNGLADYRRVTDDQSIKKVGQLYRDAMDEIYALN